MLDQPKLPVVSEGSWEAFMDGVYVNGEFYTGNSLRCVHCVYIASVCQPPLGSALTGSLPSPMRTRQRLSSTLAPLTVSLSVKRLTNKVFSNICCSDCASVLCRCHV